MATVTAVNRNEKFFNKVDKAYKAAEKLFGAENVNKMFTATEVSDIKLYTFELAAPSNDDGWAVSISKKGLVYALSIVVPGKVYLVDGTNAWKSTHIYLNRQFGEDYSVWKAILRGMVK